MLVIFDLDGTLLDTLSDLTAATNYALHTCGFAPISASQCQAFVGNGVSKLLARALPVAACNEENLTAVRAAFFTYYQAHLADHTRPYPGITELLDQLQARGIKIAVCSNKYQAASQRLMDHFFAQINFACVYGQRTGVPVKPNPAAVAEILRVTQETPETCLYVGDSDVDMQTAHNAGVTACGVTWGFRARELLARHHPRYLVDSPAEILMLPPIEQYNHRP